MNNENFIKNIADFIIKTAQEESSGFQYMVSSEDVENNFSIKIDENLKENILDELAERDEVAEVDFDGEDFDVVLYTDYAPNHEEADEKGE